MGIIKKYAAPLAALLICVLYFLSRFYNILALPIFTDEAIYIRWSQIALNDASWRFISLTDGKQPMYVWLAMISLKIIHDPLLAGRAVSVGAGFLTMTGLFFLTREIFKNSRIAALAALLYVLFPFSLVYDRVALYDSLVAMFIVWPLYLEVLLVRKIRLDLALILGMVVGAGMLTKTSADFALAFLPFSLLLFNWQDKKRNEKLLKWIGFAVITSILAFLIYSVLRLSPFFYIIAQKNTLFVYPLHEWLHHPFAYFTSNFSGLTSWLTGYSTYPFLLLVFLSFFINIKQYKEKIFLVLAFMIPFTYLTFFGKTIYPRFLLFMVMPLIVLAAYSLYILQTKIKFTAVKIIVFAAFIILFVVKDYFILTDFGHAPIPQSDLGQLITGWPSGVGVSQSVKYFAEIAKTQKIFIGTEGTFGLMPYALEIYLHNDPNITIRGFWPVTGTPPKEALAAGKNMPVYFVFYQSCPSCPQTGVAPVAWPLKQIFQIEKIQKGQFYTLYQLEPGSLK